MLSSFPSERNTLRKTEASTTPTLPLNSGFVCQRDNSLRRVVSQRDCDGIPGESRLSLNLDGNTIGSGLLLGGRVRLDSLDEVLTGSRGLDVLDSDVDALLDVAVLDLLVDDDADGALCDVVDNASLAVVDLVGHTAECVSFLRKFRNVQTPQIEKDSLPLLDSTVGLDVDNVTDAGQLLAGLISSARDFSGCTHWYTFR